MRSRSARSGHSTPRTPGSTAITPGTPPSYSSSSRGTPRSLSLICQERKVAILHTPPKSPATTPKQLRIINQPLPDFKNIKSKVGSTENIKYQPKGGQVVFLFFLHFSCQTWTSSSISSPTILFSFLILYWKISELPCLDKFDVRLNKGAESSVRWGSLDDSSASLGNLVSIALQYLHYQSGTRASSLCLTNVLF